MKKILVSTLLVSTAMAMSAQSAVDAYSLSPAGELRGTARFMSMAGAFTALGGDLSTLNQNPAGIGVYRSSELGFTLDINVTRSTVNTPSAKFSEDKTHVYANNFGYVGAVGLQSDVMRTFNWGASYSRTASFDRTFRVGSMGSAGPAYPSISSSLSNYIASFSGSWAPGVLNADQSNYNPYFDSDADWLSILAYNSYMINPNASNDGYNGLWRDGTVGTAGFDVRERGYIDEYAIDFGGNLMDVLYWGIGFGITDLQYTQEANYDEELTGARIPNNAATGTQNGNAYFNLNNYKRITGTGFNFKAGLIFRPVNELRIGMAIHTPTYYSLSQDFDAGTHYSYSSGYENMYTDSEYGYFDWKLRSPWRFMIGAAGVIGGRGIISVDYERQCYGDMHISPRNTNYDYTPENNDIKDGYQGVNIVRIGCELRVTPQFSLRAGYSNVSSAVKDEMANNRMEVFTSGLNPAYTFSKDTNYVTLGFGYRYQAFYADAAYVYKRTNSTYHAFTNYEGMAGQAPQFDFTTTDNNIVLSIGFKF